jgi:nucleoside-diphosphate-sugar epimerase
MDFPNIYLQQSYRRFTKPFNTQNNNAISRRQASREGHYIADTDRNVLIIHSSGTTGLPKAIPQAHRFLLSFAPYSSFEFESSWTVEDERILAFSTLPLYHVYGLLLPMMSLSIGKPFAIPPSAFIPSAESTLDFMAMVNPGTLFVVPSILQDIVELPDGKGLDALRPLKYIASGGGPLNASIGDKLVASGIGLINGYGGTEVGSIGVLQPPGSDRDWRFFRLRKDLGCQLKEVDPPDQPGQSTHYKMTIRPAGWTEDFEMGDYFITSAKKPNHDFRPTARVDDLIVLKTGEKVPPHILETMLSDRSDVRAALAFGQGQFEIGALIEPSYPVSDDRLAEYKDAIWSTIVDAGKKMDAHARISSPDAVVVLRPGQEFPRSGKGSVLRKASYEEFSDDIENAYSLLDNPTGTAHTVSRKPVPLPHDRTRVRTESVISSPGCKTTSASQEEIDRVINTVVQGMMGPSPPKQGSDTPSSRRSSRSFEDILSGDIEQTIMKHIQQNIWKPHASPLNTTDDLFELGMDSLQATQLRRYLINEINKSQFVQAALLTIPRDFLYTHSSITKIASYLRGETYPSASTSETSVTLDHLMNQYISTSELAPLQSETRATVLLTGGTGGLGCHLLAQLASTTSIDRVICLNRHSVHTKPNPYSRQFQSNKIKGAAIPLSVIDKVEVIEANTALPFLGLSRPVYWGIAASVTHIIHNAWPVDFKRGISSFESQFKIMNNLLDLARNSGAKPKFMFVSSIAVVAQYQSSINAQTIVPEEPFSRNWAAPAMGYGQAKLVCEKMLEQAVEEKVVEGVIARCAQISGAISNGYWNPTEYLPTLVRNSKKIGSLPDLQGVSVCSPKIS